MNTSARLGFIGVGPMGRDLLKQALQNPKASVCALCDIDETALQEAQQLIDDAVPTYAEHGVMLEREGLDGVVVAAPQYAHAELSIAALRAGVHVFCEKPMALSVTQCEGMIAAARESGKELMIGQVLRYVNHCRYMLELVRSGELGNPLAMHVRRTGGKWGGWRKKWRLQRDLCGGALFEVNVHEIDLMCCILGNPVRVSAVGGHYVNDEIDYEDLISAQLTFPDGRIGSVTSSSCDFVGQNTGEIYLEQGSIHYSGRMAEVLVCKEDEDIQHVPYDEIGKDWEGATFREIREFIETCLGDHPSTIPGQEGMRNVEICQAAYLSVREKRPIELPLT